METKKTFLLNPYDGIIYQNEIKDVELTRISPRSYRTGEHNGFLCGITVGFVAGIMFICLFFGIL